MEMLFSLLTLVGLGYGLYRGIKWMVRSGRSLAPREQPLTHNDLKVLEESAARLMADLRSVSDECVARVEAACDRAEQVMRSNRPSQVAGTSVLRRDVPQPAMLTGEAELLKGLQQITSN